MPEMLRSWCPLIFASLISHRGHQICDNLSSNNCITLFPIYSSIIVSNELSPRFDSALSFPVNMYAKRNHSMVEVSFYVCVWLFEHGCEFTCVSVCTHMCVCVCVCTCADRNSFMVFPWPQVNHDQQN